VRVLWTHNFDPCVQNSGVFVHTTAAGLRARGVDLELEYLGNLRSIPQLLRARRRVRRLARQFDVVHAQFGSACAVATAAARDVPKLVTIRGSDWNVHRATRGFIHFHTRTASAFTKSTLRSYEGVLAVSSRLAADLARFAPRAHIAVSPSPVDLSRFVPVDKQHARALLGHPDCKEKWILFNSLRLGNPIKRYELARQAFEIARARDGNLRLRLASDLPHERMPLFVAACDLILCTSDNEGWPNSIKEALACNVPFVSTDVSDLREIAHVEPTCRVCPPDPSVIAESIGDVLAMPAPTSLRRHVTGMSVEAISEQLIATYQQVLHRYRGSAADGSSRLL